MEMENKEEDMQEGVKCGGEQEICRRDESEEERKEKEEKGGRKEGKNEKEE